jgi:hypothetical protein
MNMKLKTIIATTAIAITALASTAQAASPSEVTIKGTNGDYHGKVKSADPDCLANRTVVVYMTESTTPSPQTDQKIGSDTTESDGSWSIGNSGYKHGHFYAKVKKSTDCGADTSPVIDR